MQSYKIVGIEKHYLCDHKPRLAGFRLDGIVGSVDPFVGGEFMPDCLGKFLDSNGNVIDGKTEDFFLAEIEWGKEQIGKTLVCEDLCFSAFATRGKVGIE